MAKTGMTSELKIYGCWCSATKSKNMRVVSVYVAAQTLREANRVLRDSGYRIAEKLNRIHENSEPAELALANPGQVILWDFEEDATQWQILPPPE